MERGYLTRCAGVRSGRYLDIWHVTVNLDSFYIAQTRKSES